MLVTIFFHRVFYLFLNRIHLLGLVYIASANALNLDYSKILFGENTLSMQLPVCSHIRRNMKKRNDLGHAQKCKKGSRQ